MRVEGLFQHGMTEHDDAEVAMTLDEQFAPACFAHQHLDLLAANHDRAAFIEDSEQVAQASALAAFLRNFSGVHGVDVRLRLRERQPGERVEQVMLVFGARVHRPVSYR